MKTRSDYVSNLSSSSFILKDKGFFEHFSISKQDIVDVIVGLSGMKHGNGFYVYGMKDEKERNECFMRWDAHFEGWYAPNEGKCCKWEEFLNLVRFDCDVINLYDVLDGEDDELKESVHMYESGKHMYNKIDGGANFIMFIKDKLGIKTMKEVLHDSKCTHMIHFDDNCVASVNGLLEFGKDDENEHMSKTYNDKCKSSLYDSSSYSPKRFFEILIKHFANKSKIDLSSKTFMDFWLVPENHWWRSDTRHKARKYFTENDNSASWRDVYDDMLNCNAIMHEG